MKRIYLFLLLLFTSISGFAQSNLSTIFDFSQPEKLNPTITPGSSYVYVMDKVFTQGPVNISFSYIGNGGTANIYTYTNPYTQEISYHLRCSQGTVITLFTDEDAVLDSLRFSDSSVMGRFMLQYGEPGTYSNSTKSWQSNSKTVRSVSFVNNGNLAQIVQLEVYYTLKPATLYPTSFSPANGSTMESFESLTMGFSSNMSIQETTGIKIDGPGVTGGLSTTVSGKNVILTAPEPITVDGHYTITVPSRCFKNDAGYENIPITYSFTISHVKPANLYPISVNPANGSTLSDFQVLQLNYSYDMTAQNISGIYISGPGLSAYMNAVVSGKTIYLSVPQPITTDGYYSITLPEKCFANAEGYGNASYNYNFTIKSQRNTFQMLSSDPAAGTVTSIPNGFTFLFEDIVGGVNPTNATLKIVDSNGNTVRNVTAARQGNSGTQSKTVVFTFKAGLGDITEAGTYTFVLPEQIVYNVDFDENANDYGASAGAVYNPEISLTFTIEEPPTPPNTDSETMKAAKALLQQSGIGYPAGNSNGRNALSTAISNPDNITVQEELDAQLVEAMNQFYAETNVTMPQTGVWYKIVGVNSTGNKLYLGYGNGKISLKTSEASAGAFKATVSGNTVVFETSDGKYLHVPTASNSYIGTSSSGVTDAKTYLNNLTVSKLTVDGVDNKDVLGLFKISGSLGTEQATGDAASAYALINHGTTQIATDVAETLHYESSLSNAFTFIETTKPQEDTGIKPSITLSPSKLLDSSETMTMTFTNISKAVLADDTKPFIAKDEKGSLVVATSGKVLESVAGKDNVFSVHVDGIVENGLYYLILPPGTFDFSQNGQSVYDRENVWATFILDVPEPTPTLTPSASLSASNVNPGSSLTLTISNGGTVTLKDASKAYYQKGTSAVSFIGTILSKASADNSFAVNTTGLEEGNYTLVLPAGTFAYSKDGYNVEDKEMTVSLTITKPSLTPSVSLSASSVDAGGSLTLTVSNGGTVTLKDASKAYYLKGTSRVVFDGTILTMASDNNIFAVNTTGLEEGTYTLVLPAGTFAYSEAGSNVEDKEMSVSLTIKSTTPASVGFKYSYTNYSYNTKGSLVTKTDDYIADTYLNDFIIYSYVPQDYSGLVADPTKVVKILRYRTETLVATGHFETYTNFSKDFPDYDGRVAIRLVLDEPFKGGELDHAAGLYTFEIPEATFGDANFGKYLKKPSSVKPQNCIVNPEIKDLMFQLDNKKAVPYPEKPTLTPSVELFASSVNAGSSLYLNIKDGGTVKLNDAYKAYYLKGTSKVDFEGPIISKSSDNIFAANTTGLEDGKYTLVLPAGTFTYSKDGYNVVDKEMSVSFTIIPTSSINGISSTEDDDSYYDLSGRKVTTPTKKGIYIKNGRKVVIK